MKQRTLVVVLFRIASMHLSGCKRRNNQTRNTCVHLKKLLKTRANNLNENEMEMDNERNIERRFLIQKSTHKIWIKEQIIENWWYLKKKILQYAGQVDLNQKNNAISIDSIVVGFFFPLISSVGLKVVTFTTDSFAPHDWSDGDELRHRKQFTEQKKEKKVVLWPTWNKRTQNKYTKKC